MPARLLRPTALVILSAGCLDESGALTVGAPDASAVSDSTRAPSRDSGGDGCPAIVQATPAAGAGAPLDTTLAVVLDPPDPDARLELEDDGASLPLIARADDGGRTFTAAPGVPLDDGVGYRTRVRTRCGVEAVDWQAVGRTFRVTVASGTRIQPSMSFEGALDPWLARLVAFGGGRVGWRLAGTGDGLGQDRCVPTRDLAGPADEDGGFALTAQDVALRLGEAVVQAPEVRLAGHVDPGAGVLDAVSVAVVVPMAEVLAAVGAEIGVPEACASLARGCTPCGEASCVRIEVEGVPVRTSPAAVEVVPPSPPGCAP